MDITLLNKLEQALAINQLDRVVEELKIKGISQVEIYCLFDEFLALLRQASREDEEDRVLDEMDYIIGHCSPHKKRFTHYLTSEEIELYRKARNSSG